MNNEHPFPSLPGGPAKPVSPSTDPLLARAVILLGQLKARDEERDKQLRGEVAELNKVIAVQEAVFAEEKRIESGARAEQARQFEAKLKQLEDNTASRLKAASSQQRIIQVGAALAVIAAVIVCRVL